MFGQTQCLREREREREREWWWWGLLHLSQEIVLAESVLVPYADNELIIWTEIGTEHRKKREREREREIRKARERERERRQNRCSINTRPIGGGGVCADRHIQFELLVPYRSLGVLFAAALQPNVPKRTYTHTNEQKKVFFFKKKFFEPELQNAVWIRRAKSKRIACAQSSGLRNCVSCETFQFALN